MPTPRERELNSRIAAFDRWSQEPDRTAATAPARAAFGERFEKLVDPDGTLAPEERARRAECARKAYFLRLARKSAQVRGAKSAGRRNKAADNSAPQPPGGESDLRDAVPEAQIRLRVEDAACHLASQQRDGLRPATVDRGDR